MRIIFFIVCVMLFGRVMWQSEFQMTKEQEGLLWENVEALADEENVGHSCMGVGNVVCPITGKMVEVVVNVRPYRYSLEK